MEQSSAVERKIIDAAREVFVENGYDGAKMRDIAARANINISMLHYYYRSKDNLFDIAFNQVFSRVYGRIFDVVASDADIFDKIRTIVGLYIDTLTEEPLLPNFIFNEVTQHPESSERIAKYKSFILESIAVLQKQMDAEVEKGRIRRVDMMEFFMEIESLCMYPFLTRALWQRIFDMDDTSFNAMLERRKQSFIDSIIKSIEK